MREDVFQECLRYYQSKDKKLASWGLLAEKFNYKSGEALRCEFKRERQRRDIPSRNGKQNNKCDDGQCESIDDIPYNESQEIKSDGTFVSDKLIAICEAESKSPESIMKAHGFNPDLWELVVCRNNYWHGVRPKDLGRLILYQSRIAVKPKKFGISFKDIDQFFQHLDAQVFVPEVAPLNYAKNGLVLEIDLADLHYGSVGVYETSKLADIKDRFYATIEDICQRAKDLPLEKIVFVPLGDLGHFDTVKKTTTSGTQLDSDMSFATMFDGLMSMMMWALNRLSELAPVQVYYVAGNHDQLVGYAVLKALEYAYQNNKSISFDNHPLPRKFAKIGNTLIGWAHGDLPKQNASNWLQKEGRKEWGETKYAEIHCGHTHHQTSLEKDGLVLRYLPSISNTDQWSYDQGYIGAVKSTVSFVWDQERGLREMWFSNM